MTKKEIREVIEEEKRINNYLYENDADFGDVYTTYDDGLVHISVTWGDWKHSHLRNDWLMEQIGYELVDVQVTEEDGSDTYSADRIYRKKN